MTTPSLPPRKEPSLTWLLLASLIMHGVVFVLLSGVAFNRQRHASRPVYYVDLSRLPVADPQAGRPDGGRTTAKDSPPNKTAPPATTPPKASPPKPAPAVKPKPAAKPKPKPKPAAKPKSTPAAKPKPKPAEASQGDQTTSRPTAATGARSENYQGVREKLAAMRAQRDSKREREALKNKIAALSRDDTAGSGAPLGMPGGTGDQAGVDQETWLRAFYKENWRLSKYQVSRLDLEATVAITYSSEGHLLNYRFVKSSGNATFDDSLKKAILKEKKLPFKPGRTLQIEVVFNLKDLME